MWAERCWRCSCQGKENGKDQRGRGEGGHAAKERGKMKCLTEGYGESTVVTIDGKAGRRLTKWNIGAATFADLIRPTWIVSIALLPTATYYVSSWIARRTNSSILN